MKFTILAGLVCLSSILALGQQPADPAQQAPAPQPPAQPPAPPKPTPAAQNPRDVNAKPDNTAPDDIDNYFVSAKGYYWATSGNFSLKSGAAAVSPGISTLPNYAKASNHTYGGMLTFPAGKYNRLEVSFYQAHGNGTGTAKQDLSFFGQSITQGDFLSSSFRIRQLKLSWNYLTWPAPPETSRLRIKTLWEFQWSQFQTTINAPYETSATFTPPTGTQNIYYPSFGIGAEYILTKNLYVEGRASGFAFPHHAVVWDAEGDIVAHYKFIQVFLGYKGSHLKTSPQQYVYVNGTLQGGYGGLRIVLR